MINPNALMNISDQGVHAIANHEGFRGFVYNDKTGKPWLKTDKAGFPTIGYGHLIARDAHGDLVEKFPAGLSKSDGEKLFKADLARFVQFVRDHVTVKLTQNEFDALVSLAFNIGTGALGKSTLLKVLNTGDFKAAADHFLDWRYDANHQPILLKRRQEERALFLKP